MLKPTMGNVCQTSEISQTAAVASYTRAQYRSERCHWTTVKEVARCKFVASHTALPEVLNTWNLL